MAGMTVVAPRTSFETSLFFYYDIVSEHEVCVTREVPRPRERGNRATNAQASEALSVRSPERTHRVGERVDRILERVDRILQGSLGQGRVRRTCRPGSSRRAARRKQAAQAPKNHRARAGENATDPRNQPRVASEKEAQHRRRSTQSRSWTPHQPKARRAPERARQISLHIESLAALRKRRRRLSRARRLAPAASASWATAAAAPPGGRMRGEAMCIEESVPVIIGVGRSLCSAGTRRPGLRVQKARERRQVVAERRKQRGERGRRGRGAAEQERRVCRAGEATRS